MKSAAKVASAKGKSKQLRWSFVEIIAFLAFLVWSGVGLMFTLKHFTVETVAQWHLSGGLTQFVDFCLKNGDPILIFLAFMNTHLHATRQWSAGIARGWGFIVVLVAFGVEMLGSRTGVPFGEYHYTASFGPMVLGVPLAIPPRLARRGDERAFRCPRHPALRHSIDGGRAGGLRLHAL